MSENDTALSKNLANRSGVKSESRNECQGQRTIVSTKRMSKLLKSKEDMYFAVIPRSSIQKSGVIFKVKQQIMKEKGAIRKAPPVIDTREKMCREAPVAIRSQL